MEVEITLSPDNYSAVLAAYLQTRSETDLYHASLLGRKLVERALGPDDIVALHAEALEAAIANLPYRQRATASVDALQFLLDVMIAYGVHHQHYLALRVSERTREAETATAQERQRAADAERADREKSEILATVSHELRTPLTAARGLVDLATRSLQRGLPAAQVVEHLVAARQAIDRLTRLSGELVEASRGELPALGLVPIRLRPLMEQAIAWVRPVAEQKGLTLLHECDASQLIVSGTDDALSSILTNLLSNAIRYTPAGGCVTLGCTHNADAVQIYVTDTGIGMTAEVRSRIFERFYRAPEAKAVEAAGLGLGLALTRQLVEELGGRIQVESSPGAGSTFRVMLPLPPADNQFAKEQQDG